MTDTELRPHETDLRGQWIERDGEVVGDTTCQRVKALIRSGVLAQVAGGGWETLYQDPRDGRLWELTYPQGDLHGGGPPRLAVISEAEAGAKYQIPHPSLLSDEKVSRTVNALSKLAPAQRTRRNPGLDLNPSRG